MSTALRRRLLVLETGKQADNIPRLVLVLVLVCRAGREGDTLSGLNLPDGALHRLPGESMDALKARARASIKKPGGLAVAFACYDD